MSNAKAPDPIKISQFIGKPPNPRPRRGKITRNARRRVERWNLAARYYRKVVNALHENGHMSEYAVRSELDRLGLLP